MRGLDDQVVVVTGGGGGIGRKICTRFAQEGARVAVLDIDADAARETVEAIPGERARAFMTDITDPQSVKQTVAEVVAVNGGIDALVNNAGWDRGAPFLETDSDLWAKIIAINYQGPLNMHREVLPHMLERGRRSSSLASVCLCFRCRPRRILRRGGLCRMQSRGDRLWQERRSGDGSKRDLDQRGLPRPDRHGFLSRLRR